MQWKGEFFPQRKEDWKFRRANEKTDIHFPVLLAVKLGQATLSADQKSWNFDWMTYLQVLKIR